MIEVSHLSKAYGTRQALKDLSFTLEKGKVYGFLGPNGAGKSTTMNIMTGYLAPTTGSVKVNGFCMTEQPERAKSFIGYLPEIPPVYPDMTVEEYLFFVAELKGLPKKERATAVEAVCEKVKLTEVRERMIRKLSKGYQQRTGLAQAVLGNPEIIILDEPTVGMDPQQIIEVRGLISDLRKDHVVVLSSHILSEISAVCDEILIIARGVLKAQGTVEELEQRYADDSFVRLSFPADGREDLAQKALQALEDAGISGARLQSGGNRSLEEVFLLLTNDAEEET